MERRLGAWDCPYCGNKKHLGNVFDCPGCGRPRPRGIRFYQIPDGPIVTSEIANQLGSGGPNWYCEHCDSGNKDNNTHCWKCGAERGSSPSHETKNYLEGEKVPESFEEAEILSKSKDSWVEEKIEHQSEVVETTPVVTSFHAVHEDIDKQTYYSVDSFRDGSQQIPWRPVMLLGVVAAVILCSFLIYQFFFNTHYEEVVVDRFYWEQSVVVQEYSVVKETSWSSHPADAYNVISAYLDTGSNRKVTDGWRTVSYTDSCSRTVYNSRTCSGTRDNGDGSFTSYSYECGSSSTENYPCTKTRQEEIYHYEDVYDWYYQYDVNRWLTTATYPTSGKDQAPYFYEGPVLVNISKEMGTPKIGQQKRVELDGQYAVKFFCPDNDKIGEDGYFSRDYSLGEWQKFNPDIKYQIEVNFLNTILSKPAP